MESQLCDGLGKAPQMGTPHLTCDAPDYGWGQTEFSLGTNDR